MIAIDTNVLVRLIIQDDPEQAARAERLFKGGVLILPTVVLEAVWVLQSRYGFSRREIATRLEIILQQASATVVPQTAWARPSRFTRRRAISPISCISR